MTALDPIQVGNMVLIREEKDRINHINITCQNPFTFRREIIVEVGDQTTKYEVNYQTTVEELIGMIARKQSLDEDKMTLCYRLDDSLEILNDDQVLMTGRNTYGRRVTDNLRYDSVCPKVTLFAR